jgi:1-acyl-sn-glycerol-3-phosphate acyltransferase
MVYPVSKLLIYPYYALFIKKVKGTENIPTSSNFILVSNHEKRIDPLYLIFTILKKLNKKVHFLAQPKLWFLGEKICREWAGCIPLFNAKQSYNELREFLLNGSIVGIFPEGDYNPNKMHKNLKTGVIRLAIETKKPILPVAIKSSYLPLDTIISIGKLEYFRKNNGLGMQIKKLMATIYGLRADIDSSHKPFPKKT